MKNQHCKRNSWLESFLRVFAINIAFDPFFVPEHVPEHELSQEYRLPEKKMGEGKSGGHESSRKAKEQINK